MKVGAEHREQVYLLLGLTVVAGFLLYLNLRPGPVAPSAPSPGAAPGHPDAGRGARRSTGESQPFHPGADGESAADSTGCQHGPDRATGKGDGRPIDNRPQVNNLPHSVAGLRIGPCLMGAAL